MKKNQDYFPSKNQWKETTKIFLFFGFYLEDNPGVLFFFNFNFFLIISPKKFWTWPSFWRCIFLLLLKLACEWKFYFYFCTIPSQTANSTTFIPHICLCYAFLKTLTGTEKSLNKRRACKWHNAFLKIKDKFQSQWDFN